jgi:hypothetical protein
MWVNEGAAMGGRRAAADFVSACLFLSRCRQDYGVKLPSAISTSCRCVRTVHATENDALHDFDYGHTLADTLSALQLTPEFTKGPFGLDLLTQALDTTSAAAPQPKPIAGVPPQARPPVAAKPAPPSHDNRENQYTTSEVHDEHLPGTGTSLPPIVKHRETRAPRTPDEEPEIRIEVEQPLQTEDALSLSYAGHQARLRSARYRHVIDNQFLPWAWDRLNVHEISTLVHAIRTHVRVGDVTWRRCWLLK